MVAFEDEILGIPLSEDGSRMDEERDPEESRHAGLQQDEEHVHHASLAEEKQERVHLQYVREEEEQEYKFHFLNLVQHAKRRGAKRVSSSSITPMPQDEEGGEIHFGNIPC